MSTVTNRNLVEQPVAAPPGAASDRPKSAIRLWVRRAGPTAAVVTSLAALAFWGHSTGWTIPKFSSLVGGAPEVGEKWCQDHNVADDVCIECNPALLPPMQNFGWCKEHGVAQCPFEHPEVAQLREIPFIDPESLVRAQRALSLKPRPQNNSHCALHQRRIQFASAAAIEKAGIEIAVVEERPVVEAVVANGEVVYDQNRMAHLSSRVAGTVWRVEKQVGDIVRKGDVLAIIDAAEVGKAKGEFLQTIAQFRLQKTNTDRLRSLASDGGIAAKVVREAETAFEESRIRLQSAQQTLINLGLAIRAEEFDGVDTDEIAHRIQFLGIPIEAIANLDAASTTSSFFPLRTSLDGVVIERDVVEGEVVDSSTALFNVADISRMWLTLNVRQEDAPYVSLGQSVLFQPNHGSELPEIQGKVSWISTSADDETRTVRVRVELPNTDNHLRANTYGTGRIVLRAEPKAAVVPKEAVHWDGSCNIVFVRDKNFHSAGAPKFFHVRTVRPGVTDGDTTEIIAGLLPGEIVASKNSVVLASQLLKSNLGAGCCEVHAPKK
jgi:cobalt-zinc-cadmium efflux system membrane fusion protein